MSSKSFYGPVGVCLHYNFSWSDNHFFGSSLQAKYILVNVSWHRVVHTNASNCNILKKKKRKKNIAISEKDFFLVKLRFLFPLLRARAIRCPQHETGSSKKKKAVELGMTGQNCTSLHWIPYILDRRQLTLAHQATFQIGRQFRFPWQPAENGWLEIGLYWLIDWCFFLETQQARCA